jgi:hypothetical protein
MWKAGPGVLQSGRTSRSTPDASRFAANRRELDGQGGFIHHHGPIDQDLQRLHTLLQLPVVDGTGSHPPPDAAMQRQDARLSYGRRRAGSGHGPPKRRLPTMPWDRSLPAIYPDAMAPVVRQAGDGERELTTVRWGMPGRSGTAANPSPTSATSAACICGGGLASGTALGFGAFSASWATPAFHLATPASGWRCRSRAVRPLGCAGCHPGAAQRAPRRPDLLEPRQPGITLLSSCCRPGGRDLRRHFDPDPGRRGEPGGFRHAEWTSRQPGAHLRPGR